MPKLTYGSRIHEVRTTLGLSLRDLAERAGVGASFLSRLENDDIKDLSFARAVAICDALGLSLDELAGRGDLKTRGRPDLRKIRHMLKEVLDQIERP